MDFLVYLAGHIHGDWRNELANQVNEKGLPFEFVSPQTNHELSDNIGENILGQQPSNYHKDDVASSINNFRTQVLMEKADIVIALFEDDYKNWNTAMDATTAVNSGKPLIIIRPEDLHHPLKELSNKANVTVENITQAVEVLEYVLK